MGRRHGRSYVEAGQRAGGSDGAKSDACEAIAIGMRDFFDQSKHMKALELSRHCPRSDVQVCEQISTTPAVDSELAVLQGSQQGLLGGVEEIQAVDAGVGTDTPLTRPLQITLTRAGIVQAGQECQVALIPAQQHLAQIDQTVDSLLRRRQFSPDAPILVFHLAVVLENAQIVDGMPLHTTRP